MPVDVAILFNRNDVFLGFWLSDFELDHFEFRFFISVCALYIQITTFFNTKQTTKPHWKIFFDTYQ